MSPPVRWTRRRWLQGAAALPLWPAWRPARAARPASAARIVVVGGGFGGAACARYLRLWDPGLAVTLVEPAWRHVTGLMSNAVIGGLRELDSISHGYERLVAAEVRHVPARAVALDFDARVVVLTDGERLQWDRLVLAPGVEFDYRGIEGAEPGIDAVWPHAWQAGAQTVLLARQLAAMRPGGVFVMTIPDNPYRCPPGPYERASLVADWCRRHNPTAKILLLDAKDSFTKQALFEEAWAARYPGMIEWLGGGAGARLTAVDPGTGTFMTEFDGFRADVGNLIPPQRAPALLRDAGLDGGLGWCAVDPATFESRVVAGVHVLGDASNANPMPKSAFAANSQAKACAAALIAQLRDQPPPPVLFMNTCYSLAAADYGISIAGVYRPIDGVLTAMPDSVGTSPLAAPAAVREREARYAFDAYTAIVRDTFG